jgi:hypothetical protein
MTFNYVENVALKAPGLAIQAGSSAIVKAVNVFMVKAQKIISLATSANTDMPGLASALGVSGAPTSNLADGYSRVYTFLASVSATGVLAFTVVHGADFVNTRAPKTSDFNFGNAIVDATTNDISQDDAKALVGFIIVKNASGAVFVPGTTALDASNVTVTYLDAFGWSGM